MPLYEYECEAGHKSEAFRPMSEYDLPNQCPECDKVARRIISRLAKRNPFDQRMPFTVYNHDGSVVGKSFDLKPTPHPEEYYDVKKLREEQMADAESITKEALCQI